MASPSTNPTRRRAKSSSPRLGSERRHARYEWHPLAEDDIRVITLLQGRFDDDIRIQIEHTQLPVPVDPASARRPIEELRKTLPPGWSAEETLDGRYIFFREEPCTRHDDRVAYNDRVEYFDRVEYNDDRVEWKATAGCDNLFLVQRDGVTVANTSRTWTHPDPTIPRSEYELPTFDATQPHGDGYEAVSYVWGSKPKRAKRKKFALVETLDGTSDGTVSISKNLDCAVRHLRFENKPRKLWIDAICINQGDDAEKSVQVRRMARIYQSASRVIAWIGPEADGSDHALSTLEYLGDQIVVFAGYLLPSPDAHEEDWYQVDKHLPYGADTWTALHSLLDREWFRRRWVVQEIGVANHHAIIQCGRRELPWALFTHTVYCLRNKPPPPLHSLRDSFRRTSVFVEGRRAGMTARVVLWKYSNTKCSDMRDTVYALLGIMPPKFAARINPDYSQSPMDLFRDVFLAHTRQTQRRELFDRGLQDRQCGGPSWVPDLTMFQGNDESIAAQFSAGFSRMCYTVPSPALLEVTGLRCATVDSTTPNIRLWENAEEEDEAKRIIRSWEPPGIDTATYITGDSLSDVHALTLLRNYTLDRWPGLDFHPSLKEWKAVGGNGLFTASVEPEQDSPPLYKRARIEELSRFSCADRTYMVTKEGYIGLGPPGVKSGNVLRLVMLSVFS